MQRKQSSLHQFFKVQTQNTKNSGFQSRIEKIKLQGTSGNLAHLNELLLQLNDQEAQIRLTVSQSLRKIISSNRCSEEVFVPILSQLQKESNNDVKNELKQILKIGKPVSKSASIGVPIDNSQKHPQSFLLPKNDFLGDSSSIKGKDIHYSSQVSTSSFHLTNSSNENVDSNNFNGATNFSRKRKLTEEISSIQIEETIFLHPTKMVITPTNNMESSPNSSPLSPVPSSPSSSRASISAKSNPVSTSLNSLNLSSFSRRSLNSSSSSNMSSSNSLQRNTKRFKLDDNSNSQTFSSNNRGSIISNVSEIKVIPDTRPRAELSEEQQKVLELAKSGKSFFFTGAAGTGKSYLLREIIREMQTIYGYNIVHVTASTGIAACNIGGCTVHSFAGVGIGEAPVQELISIVKKNKIAKERWISAKLIVIDEISMLSGEFFDKLETIARAIRKNEQYFGGIQIILCGDFLQLPPVEKRSKDKVFCFESQAWKGLAFSIELKKVFRQQDSNFVNILNEIRSGTLSDKSLQTLEKCLTNKLPSSQEEFPATRLYPLKSQVEEENMRYLQALSGQIVKFISEDSAKYNNPSYMSLLEKSCIAPKELQLKKGAQVILLKNLNFDKGLVNGARGKVIDFEKSEDGQIGDPIVQFISGYTTAIAREEFSFELGGDVICKRRQIPLDLAWAISIHKSQGMTIPKVILNLKHSFEYGMIYTALSRATSLEGIQLIEFNPRQIKSHPKVLEFYNSFSKNSSSQSSNSQDSKTNMMEQTINSASLFLNNNGDKKNFLSTSQK